jgi:hypothetical protein
VIPEARPALTKGHGVGVAAAVPIAVDVRRPSALGHQNRAAFRRISYSSLAVLYFRFPLSLRLVEEMLLERGIVVSYETVGR